MSKTTKPLAIKHLNTRCNPRDFPFTSTKGIHSDEDIVGQERAVAAIQYGLDMHHKGNNIYVMGPPGYGKYSLTETMVIRKSRLRAAAKDWCYVYNFHHPIKPKALELPPGMGRRLQNDMNTLIDVFHTDFSETLARDSINKLKHAYAECEMVVQYLKDVLENVIATKQEFFNKPRTSIMLFDQPHIETPPFSRMKVNLLIDNSKTIGAPVVYEDNPIYHNLIGRVENMSVSGSLVSDFMLIRPGSLHRANHGYLILDVYEVLTHHLAWEGLKRTLHKEEIRIEPLEQSIEFWSSQTLEPEPIPLDIKVILVGDRENYYLMCENEPDFLDLFQVVADFDAFMPRNKTNNLRFAKKLGSIIEEEKLKPFDRCAVCRVIEYSSRLVEDHEKLSTHIHSFKTLIQQADYVSTQAKREITKAEDVTHAIHLEKQRLNRYEMEIHEDIHRDFILIHTSGKKVGQVNALTIICEGDYAFGQPARVTATIYLGDGSVIDIQREVDMCGPIYSRGVLSLSSFLRSRYNRGEKLSLSACITLEQLYSSIHGDSASVAELIALLSAIGHLPVKQSIAMTGAINQLGEIQAVAGVNEKIEGFFGICSERGLRGDQGVIIPRVNVKSLMLDEEVVEAARNKEFFIYAVDTIDEVLTILTDLPAGRRRKNGEFQKGTANQLIELSLQNLASELKERPEE